MEYDTLDLVIEKALYKTNITVDRMLAVFIVDQSLTPDTAYGLKSKRRARNKTWTLTDVIPKQKQKTKSFTESFVDAWIMSREYHFKNASHSQQTEKTSYVKFL